MVETETPSRVPDAKRLLVVCIVLSLAVSLLATFVMARSIGYSLFEAGNLVGPTAKSLLNGQGGDIDIGEPYVVRAARMPMATLVVAGIAAFVGPHRYLLASLVKALLLLVPIWGAMRLVFRVAAPEARLRVAGLLLAPFAITAFLADVANLQVEEGYAYSFLAYAFALVLFPDPATESKRPYGRALRLGFALAGLFLTKSSLILVAAVLVVAYLVQQRRWGPRILVLTLVLGTVVGWGIRQKEVSGRFAIGTSLDGINLHKGNNARFAERYPPPSDNNLDRYDSELSPVTPFVDEWAFDDYHKAEAMRYIREHPGGTLREDAKKAFQYFVSLSKSGSTESHGALRIGETAGLVLFRLGFWVACVLSIRGIFTGKGPGKFASWTFLGVALMGAVPYLLGFAYTRHASVLIYPVALLLCRALPARPSEARV